MNTNNEIDSKEEIVLVPRTIIVSLLFFFVGLPFVLLFGVIGFLITGYSAKSDVIFAIYALPSGIIADFILKRRFKIVTLLTDKPRIPFIYAWVAICILMFLGTLNIDDTNKAFLQP